MWPLLFWEGVGEMNLPSEGLIYCSVNSESKLRTSASEETWGMKGVARVRSMRPWMCRVWNQGWDRIWSTPCLLPSLFSGCLMNSPSSRLLRSPDRFSGMVGCHSRMSLKSTMGSLLMKGGRPVTISKMMHPTVQKSTALPWPSSLTISGAKYSVVPQILKAWGNIEYGEYLVVGGDVEFAESEVSEFDEALPVYDDILWFEVSIDDVPVVEVFESQQYLGGVEAGVVFTEFPPLL